MDHNSEKVTSGLASDRHQFDVNGLDPSTDDWNPIRGVARNLLRGIKNGVWGTDVQGQSLGEGLGAKSTEAGDTMLNIRLNIGPTGCYGRTSHLKGSEDPCHA